MEQRTRPSPSPARLAPTRGQVARIAPARQPAAKSDGKPRGTRSVVEVIIEKIKEGIVQGRFAPGQRLIEGEIQKVFEVSRGPIREAIRRLAAEGMVELRHNAGATVRSLTRADVCKLFDVREVLEGLAARLAARLAASRIHDAKEMRAELLKLQSTYRDGSDGSARAYMQYNDEFHSLIVRMSGNAQLIGLIAQVQVRVYRLQLHALHSPRAFAAMQREHEAVVTAVLAGDGAGAERAMRRHIRQSLALVLADSADLFA
jgi:DNA-binding GntR family transcriptional regulator